MSTEAFTRMAGLRAGRRFSKLCGAAAFACLAVGLSTTPPARAAVTVSFAPVGDAYVSEAGPDTNFGTAADLRMQSSPALTGYLLFDPAGMPGSVTSASLRVRANTGSGHGFDLRAVQDTSWSEQTLTYRNAPVPSATITASTGAFSAGQWISLDVTQLVQGNGPVTFALTRPRTTPVAVSSKDAGVSFAPELVVTTEGNLPPGNTSLPSVTGSAQEGRTLAAHAGSWNGTEPIAYTYAWQRCDRSGADCGDIPGASADTYPVAEADVGSMLRVVVSASNPAGDQSAASPGTLTVLAAGVAPLVVAAGDIACDPADPAFNLGSGTATGCQQLATSNLFFDSPVAAVLPLGDEQYECGASPAWEQSYALSWGRVRQITRPVPGNHEYETTGGTGCDTANAGAAGYFQYFGALAGDPGKGYYSYDLGSWHMVALNSNCGEVGGCGAGSAQEQRLRHDLAASSASCTLAYWHHPLFTSGAHAPGSASVRPLFQALYDNGVEMLLTGHDHNYERFAPQAPSGALDLAHGVREFVVGTGGRSLYAQGTPLPNSEARNSRTFGILELTLYQQSYAWRFRSASSGAVEDSQSQACQNPPHDTSRPSAPTGLRATPADANTVDLSWTAATDNLGTVRYEIYRD